MTYNSKPNRSRFGKILILCLESRGMSQSDLSDILWRPQHVINDLITGKREVDFDLALELEIVFPERPVAKWFEIALQDSARENALRLVALQARVNIYKSYPGIRKWALLWKKKGLIQNLREVLEPGALSNKPNVKVFLVDSLVEVLESRIPVLFAERRIAPREIPQLEAPNA